MTNVDLHYRPRFWHCEQCGQILGLIIRDGQRIRRLFIFASTLKEEQMPAWEQLIALPRGLFRIRNLNSGEVECGVCGAIREWRPANEIRKPVVLTSAVEVTANA